MKHYYLNLPKKNNLQLAQNEKISDGIFHAAKRAFKPFETYLNNTMEALKKKEDVTATWKKINAQNIAELRLIGKLYEIPNNRSHYQVIAEDLEDLDFDESIIYKFGGEKGKIKITQTNFDEKQIYIEGVTAQKFDSVTWSGEPIELRPLWSDEKQQFTGIVIREDPERTLESCTPIIRQESKA